AAVPRRARGHAADRAVPRGGVRLRHGLEHRVGLPASLRPRHVDRHLRDARAEAVRHGVLRERGPAVPPSPLARGAAASRARLGQSLLPRRRRGVHDGTTEPARWPNASLTSSSRRSASWPPSRSCWWPRWGFASRVPARFCTARAWSAGTGTRSRCTSCVPCTCTPAAPAASSPRNTTRGSSRSAARCAGSRSTSCQLLNVLRGDMSLVGPRPQHPDIVRSYYAPEHGETLRVRPGLASPGSLYDSTHGEPLVGSVDPERAYAERLLPLVLALDRVYVRRASLW